MHQDWQIQIGDIWFIKRTPVQTYSSNLLDKMAGKGPDEWLERIKKCQSLTENEMKQLCEMVKELLMEESNIQPVQTPVTVCGDIHLSLIHI